MVVVYSKSVFGYHYVYFDRDGLEPIENDLSWFLVPGTVEAL